MYQAGLILEGGGMRGVFTAGVLDFFLDKNIEFSSCYGVSAGACNACSFLSKQKGRSYDVIADYIGDKRYCGLYSLITTGDLFGADFLYNVIPNELNPFDYETFRSYRGRFYAVMTDCKTGLAVYYPVRDLKKDITAVQASSSLPLVSRMVSVGGRKYLDGGISDSIPLRRSIKDGNRKNVVILTRSSDYRKPPFKLNSLVSLRYLAHPELAAGIRHRSDRYNDTLDFIRSEEDKGSTFVIRPEQPIKISRIEKDPKKLRRLYRDGYRCAARHFEELLDFLNAEEIPPAKDKRQNSR